MLLRFIWSVCLIIHLVYFIYSKMNSLSQYTFAHVCRNGGGFCPACEIQAFESKPSNAPNAHWMSPREDADIRQLKRPARIRKCDDQLVTRLEPQPVARSGPVNRLPLDVVLDGSPCCVIREVVLNGSPCELESLPIERMPIKRTRYFNPDEYMCPRREMDAPMSPATSAISSSSD